MGQSVETLRKMARLRNRAIRWGLILLIPVGLLVAAWKGLDRFVLHRPVTATVTAVGEECELYHPRIERQPRMACAQARALSGTSRYDGYDVRRHHIVHYRFRSPADDRVHEGRGDLPSGSTPPSAGSTIEIRAHRWRAGASQL